MPQTGGPRGGKRHGRGPLPDPAHLHLELRRPGVTLQLLHLEYLELRPRATAIRSSARTTAPGSASAARRCARCTTAATSLFVDCSGNKPHSVEPKTGEVTEVELFVAALGASSFVYAEATLTQQVPDWIGSHVRRWRAWEAAHRSSDRASTSGAPKWTAGPRPILGGSSGHSRTPGSLDRRTGRHH
jgi:transposase